MGLAALWALGLSLQPASAQEGAEHPRLVSLESTDCTLCHGDLIEGLPTVHPPVADDCTICHDMTLGEGGTRVAFVDTEPALCLLCHDDLTRAVEVEVATPHAPVVDSCLTCHNPHASEHPRLLVEPLVEVCGMCHDLGDLGEVHGGQLTTATNCVGCHQPHGSDSERMLLGSTLHPPFSEGSCQACHRQPFGDRIRLRRRGEALCTACHADLAAVEAPAGGSVHGALHGERGRAGCLSCHNPHMSAQRRLLLEPSPTLCGECHGEVVAAAEAATGHPPAGDDCLTCHLPHTSGEPKLLAEPAGELCALCHDLEDEELAAAHLGADLSSLACIRCHTPHGSGHPKLLARTLHPPVVDGCDLCHEGASDELLEDGEAELCLLCHDDVGEAAAAAEVPHAALELAACTQCHNPHATPQDRLIKLPGGRECYDCHDDKFAEEGEVAHRVIELVGCRACHEPHGGDRPHMLRKTGAELCLSCHDPRAVEVEEGAQTAQLLGRFPVPAEQVKGMATLRLSADGQQGHPVVGHRVLGTPTPEELEATETTFQGELTCLTCHNPHKGRSEQLLQWDAASALEACVHCHPK